MPESSILAALALSLTAAMAATFNFQHLAEEFIFYVRGFRRADTRKPAGILAFHWATRNVGHVACVALDCLQQPIGGRDAFFEGSYGSVTK